MFLPTLSRFGRCLLNSLLLMSIYPFFFFSFMKVAVLLQDVFSLYGSCMQSFQLCALIKLIPAPHQHDSNFAYDGMFIIIA